MSPRELYYDVARANIQSQDAQHRDLETKSLRLTTASLAIVGLLVAMIQSEGKVAGWELIPATAVAITVVASIVLTFVALWTQDFHLNPKLDEFAGFMDEDEYADWDKDRWLKWVGRAICMAYHHNEAIIEKKACLIRWNQVATLVLLLASLPLVVAVTVRLSFPA